MLNHLKTAAYICLQIIYAIICFQIITLRLFMVALSVFIVFLDLYT